MVEPTQRRASRFIREMEAYDSMKLPSFLLVLLMVSLALPLLNFQVPTVKASPAYEDFTDYVEEDPNSHIEKTSSRVTFTGITRIESAYVYKDKGANHFSGDFDHKLDVRYTACLIYGHVYLWGLYNAIGDSEDAKGSPTNYLGVYFKGEGIDNAKIVLLCARDGTEYPAAGSTWSDPVVDTTYYLRIKRTGNTVTCDVYGSASNRDNEVSALANLSSGDMGGATSYQYIYACQSITYTGDYTMSGYVENLDLQEVVNNVPVNDSCTITDMDDTDNLYAQISGGYTVDYDGHDDDGYIDIDYVLVNLTQATTVRVSFKYTNSTDSFSIIDGSDKFTLDGSSSASRSGNNVNLTIVFHVQWDATEEADLEIKCVIADDEPSSDTDTMQTDYCDIITNLVVSEFVCDDDRGDLSQTIAFSGIVYYADNPASPNASSFYPPDAEFTQIDIHDASHTVKGTDSMIVNGVFSDISFSAESTVSITTYHAYINMNDTDYTDGDESPTDTFIADQMDCWSIDDDTGDQRIDVGSTFEIRYKIQYDYDDTEFNSTHGSISGFTWDSGNSWWNKTVTGSSSVTSTNYDETYVSITETQYSITVKKDIAGLDVITDRIKILTLVADPTNPTVGDYAKINATAVLEYDNHPLGSGDSLTIEELALLWNSGEFMGFEKKDSAGSKTYQTFTSGYEATYGITVGNMDGHSVTVTWSVVVSVYAGGGAPVPTWFSLVVQVKGVPSPKGVKVGVYRLDDVLVKEEALSFEGVAEFEAKKDRYYVVAEWNGVKVKSKWFILDESKAVTLKFDPLTVAKAYLVRYAGVIVCLILLVATLIWLLKRKGKKKPSYIPELT